VDEEVLSHHPEHINLRRRFLGYHEHPDLLYVKCGLTQCHGLQYCCPYHGQTREMSPNSFMDTACYLGASRSFSYARMPINLVLRSWTMTVVLQSIR
jgi:hypothetical protein